MNEDKWTDEEFDKFLEENIKLCKIKKTMKKKIIKKENLFGWILPSRTVVPCKLHSHLEEIFSNEEMTKLLPDHLKYVKDKLDALKETIYSSDEEPEWHRYSCCIDEYEFQIRKALYNAGCVRYGTYSNRMCFEGTESAIRNLKQKCDDFSEENNFSPEYSPVR